MLLEVFCEANHESHAVPSTWFEFGSPTQDMDYHPYHFVDQKLFGNAFVLSENIHRTRAVLKSLRRPSFQKSSHVMDLELQERRLSMKALSISFDSAPAFSFSLSILGSLATDPFSMKFVCRLFYFAEENCYELGCWKYQRRAKGRRLHALRIEKKHGYLYAEEACCT